MFSWLSGSNADEKESNTGSQQATEHSVLLCPNAGCCRAFGSDEALQTHLESCLDKLRECDEGYDVDDELTQRRAVLSKAAKQHSDISEAPRSRATHRNAVNAIFVRRGPLVTAEAQGLPSFGRRRSEQREEPPSENVQQESEQSKRRAAQFAEKAAEREQRLKERALQAEEEATKEAAEADEQIVEKYGVPTQ